MQRSLPLPDRPRPFTESFWRLSSVSAPCWALWGWEGQVLQRQRIERSRLVETERRQESA